jgi:predicted nucleic acid-binding protein
MSGPEWLIDTNVVIGLLKGHEPAVRLAEDVQLDLNRSAVSQITRMELLGFPLLAEAEAFQITNFLACCQVHLRDEQIEAQAIQLRRLSGLKLPDVTYRTI